MLRLIRSRLEIKILLLLSLVLIAGFGTYVVLSLQRESEGLLQQQREKLKVATETLSAGIRNVMLTGKSPYTVEMVNDVRQNLSFIDITIFDRFGREVFLREGEGVGNISTDSSVREALATGGQRWVTSDGADGLMLLRTEALFNRQECQRCHDPKERIRGALQVGLKSSFLRDMASAGSEDEMAIDLGKVIASAFRAIMVGGNGEHADTLMRAAERIPGVIRAQVYDRFGGLYFGSEESVMDEDAVTRVLDGPGVKASVRPSGRALIVTVPLANEERCQVCHGAKHTKRGLLAVTVGRDAVISMLGRAEDLVPEVVQAAVIEGFRSMMLVGRAGSVRIYMDELRDIVVLGDLRVFDAMARERFLNPQPRIREGLAHVIQQLDTLEVRESRDGDERLVRVVPIANEPRCYSCHGSKHSVRAAVEVSTSMAEVNDRIRTNTFRSAAVGILTLGLVWLVLRIFMRRVVVKPIQTMERVAARVGRGDLSVRSDLQSNDELGSLARHLNDMVRGLRQRLKLEKFVSQQTIEAVRTSDEKEIALGGVRKTATVLFSDIRGFTSYSERTHPERVVSMLNDILSAQAAIVKEHGGDIDKYVGDELVAVFEGRGMVDRAVRAAVEIQSKLQRYMAAEDVELIRIGIGINTGDMVMGAMGSPDRMDFTVIGDAVNLGARLCSAAPGGSILLSGHAYRALESAGSFSLKSREPIHVKGKKDAIEVFEVAVEQSDAQTLKSGVRTETKPPRKRTRGSTGRKRKR